MPRKIIYRLAKSQEHNNSVAEPYHFAYGSIPSKELIVNTCLGAKALVSFYFFVKSVITSVTDFMYRYL
jgi:hypothetical protein